MGGFGPLHIKREEGQMKIEQRRHLTDLYARGESVNLAPEGQPEFQVWVRKMTPADAEVSYLKAGAKRSSVLALEKEDPPGDLYATLRSEVDQLQRASLVVWVSAQELAKKRPQIEARVAGMKEWADERYLLSLQERAIEPDFLERYAEDRDDAEVSRVLGELERYRTQVDDEIVREEGIFTLDAEAMDDDELRDEVMHSMIATHADAAWLAEFQRCQIWRCVCDADDHSKKVFANRTDVEGAQVEVIDILRVALDRIHVGDMEGKDLQQTPDSSPVSV